MALSSSLLSSLVTVTDVALLVGLVLVFAGLAYLLFRVIRKERPVWTQEDQPKPKRTPKPAPVDFARPSPPPAKPSGKSAEQIFRETFPGVKPVLEPLPAVPFAIRLIPEREEIRVDVQGSIPVT